MTIWQPFSSRPMTIRSAFSGMFLFGDAPSGDFNKISEGMTASEGKKSGHGIRGTRYSNPDVTAHWAFSQATKQRQTATAVFKIEYECLSRDRTFPHTLALTRCYRCRERNRNPPNRPNPP